MGIFDHKNIEKYSRQLIIEQIGLEGQKKIFNTSICVVGCGGLGTSVSQYLAMAGIGKFHFIDSDKIELSNLNRQVMFIESDIGKNKAEVGGSKGGGRKEEGCGADDHAGSLHVLLIQRRR